jgi:mycofactocin precursor
MSEETVVEAAPAVRVEAAPSELDNGTSAVDDAAGEALLESLLVEEVSIDGMCGVY